MIVVTCNFFGREIVKEFSDVMIAGEWMLILIENEVEFSVSYS